MREERKKRVRYGETFRRAHHEARKRSTLNQREYCEVHDLLLKAFRNSRAIFKTEPKPKAANLPYRRGGVSHRLSHSTSHRLGQMTNEAAAIAPLVPPPSDGRRRKFTADDNRRILAEAQRSRASIAEVARRYGIAVRVLFRWKSANPATNHVQAYDVYTSSLSYRVDLRQLREVAGVADGPPFAARLLPLI
jgi:hypothetical protein